MSAADAASKTCPVAVSKHNWLGGGDLDDTFSVEQDGTTITVLYVRSIPPVTIGAAPTARPGTCNNIALRPDRHQAHGPGRTLVYAPGLRVLLGLV